MTTWNPSPHSFLMVYIKYSILEFVFRSVLSWFIPFPPLFPLPSFSSFVDGPQQGFGDALGTACSPQTSSEKCICDCGLEAEGERLMCSTMLKRLGQQLPPCTGMHLWHSSHGTRAQPAPASCSGSHGNPSTMAREFFKKNWYIEYIYIFTHFYWKWKFYYGNLV